VNCRHKPARAPEIPPWPSSPPMVNRSISGLFPVRYSSHAPFELSIFNCDCLSPLSPTIPTLTVHSPVTPTIPTLTKNRGWGGSTRSICYSVILPTFVGAPTFPASAKQVTLFSPPPPPHSTPRPKTQSPQKAASTPAAQSPPPTRHTPRLPASA